MGASRAQIMIAAYSASMHVIPFIYYEDSSAAIEWLKEAFRFEEHVVHRGDDGTIEHAELRLGSGMIMPGALSTT